MLKHLLRRLLGSHHYSFGTLVGLVLVLLNVPVGWGGALLMTGIALHWHQPLFLSFAAACYALSWIMLGAGIALAGRDTVRAFRARIPRAWRAWRRLRHHGHHGH